jgi:SAM-dependent methyltransferase
MSNLGLYKLVGGAENDELTSEEVAESIKPEMFPEDQRRLLRWSKELAFWEEYGRIYLNLEKARPYRNLAETIKEFLEPKKGDIWLDAGCGPLRISELIYDKSEGRIKKIEAIDIVLQPARDKLAKLTELKIFPPINLKYASLTDPLPYVDNFFDGIGANLILSYIIDFQGKTGKKAFEGVLKEIFRVLKPGGQLIWSTPKHRVNFVWVFIVSIPDMLNIYEYIVNKDVTRISQGISILKHALEIQKKGKEGVYTFLPRDELEEILYQVGFVSPVWKETFAKQVWVNRVKKPKITQSLEKKKKK